MFRQSAFQVSKLAWGWRYVALSYLAAGLGCLVCLGAPARAAESADAQADTVYVSDVLTLNMRSAPGDDAPVMRPSLTSGDTLQVLGRDADSSFVQVRTEDGRSGWVHGRYLVDTPNARSRLQALQQRAESLQERAESLQETVEAQRLQVQDLSAERAEAEAASEIQAERLAALQMELDQVKSTSNGAMETQAANAALVEENAGLRDQVQDVNREYQRLEASKELRWLLAGGGLLAAGLILGYFVGARRRRGGWS